MNLGEVLWGRKPLQRSARDPDDVDWIYVDSLAMVVADDKVARAHLGEPAARACPSGGGGGPFDAWILTCACGLELFVTTRHRDPGAWWIGANDPDIDHVLHHAALPGTVTWRYDESPWEVLPLRVDPWVLRRYDDNGQHFEVHRFASRMAAECSLRTFEARGHRQTYVIEPAVAGHSPSSVRSHPASDPPFPSSSSFVSARVYIINITRRSKIAFGIHGVRGGGEDVLLGSTSDSASAVGSLDALSASPGTSQLQL